MRAAVVVAHPDDETLWGAGWILANPDDEFTVICCSQPTRDPVRLHQLQSACGVLGASNLYVLGGKDRGHKQPLDLSTMPSLRSYDYVVTHNHLGEYGHPHHVQVNRYVREHFEGWQYWFGRGLEYGGHYFQLNDEQRAKKLQALQCYDYATSVDKKPKWEALIDRYFSGNINEFLLEEKYVSER